MMSMGVIRAESRKAAQRAAARRLRPFVAYDANEINEMGSFPFPQFGDEYSPPGWTFVEELFCDASGLGSENEPAMTVSALKRYMIEKLDADETYGYAVGQVGQFQLYVRVFKKPA